jgi:haloacetate dehalogenase
MFEDFTLERIDADFLRAIQDPATVHGVLEDYRAGLGIDVEHDAADRAAGRRIACPTLVVWSERDDMEELYGDPLAIWSTCCDDVRATTIDSGHHVAEEAPEALAELLLGFLDGAAGR